jgi:hypothetical protein
MHGRQSIDAYAAKRWWYPKERLMMRWDQYIVWKRMMEQLN